MSIMTKTAPEQDPVTLNVTDVLAHRKNAPVGLWQPNQISESAAPSNTHISTEKPDGARATDTITDRITGEIRAKSRSLTVQEIVTTLGFQADEIAGARTYVSRRDRQTHPPGRFDSAGRFWAEEHFPCCAGLRSPSRAYPYPQMTHCRSLDHVAHLHNAHRARVRAAVRLLDDLGALSLVDIDVLWQRFGQVIRRSAKAALDDAGDTMSAHERMRLHRLAAPKKR